MAKDKTEKCFLELDAGWGLKIEKNAEAVTKKFREDLITMLGAGH